jgi:hypothetical protein
MDLLEIRVEISSIHSAMSSWASLWELSEDALGSNIKMSSQKALAILHWFTARYGDNSPVSCHCATTDVLNGSAELVIVCCKALTFSFFTFLFNELIFHYIS